MLTRSVSMLMAIVFAIGLTASGREQASHSQKPQKQNSSAPDQAIKVTITAGGGMFGPVRDRFRVGEAIPIVISMTNTAGEVAQVYVSDDINQNRPELTKDGRPVPYRSLYSEWLREEKKDPKCNEDAPRELHDLLPNTPLPVDWFMLCDGADDPVRPSWYEPLQPGKYELILRRSFECCYKQQAESNKLTFEVIP